MPHSETLRVRGMAVDLLRQGSGDVLLFLHADTRPPDHFVECIFMTLMNQGTIAGAFRFKTDLDRPLMKVIEYMTNMRSRVFNLPYGDQGLFLSFTRSRNIGMTGIGIPGNIGRSRRGFSF